MIQNSRLFAGAISLGIALLASVPVALAGMVSPAAAITIFLVAAPGGFVIVSFALRSIVVRPLQHVLQRLREESSSPANSQTRNEGPLELANECMQEIERFALAKEREIERLKKLEAFRRDFIADVSHELKTPIFAAQGFVHTLLDGAVKEKAVRKKFLKKAAKSLDGLDMLVQDLLTLSQIETGQIKMRLEEIDLYALTLDVFDQLRGKSDKKEITLHIDGPVRKVTAYADWQRIRQVMTNLVSNAIKHSHEGGEIVVRFVIRKRTVVTRVEDRGEGIPPEHTGRIFERFYRVDKSRSREKGGTGLGLAIVKHILEGHHAIPEVESQPGKGSTFSFKLSRFQNEEKVHGDDQPTKV